MARENYEWDRGSDPVTLLFRVYVLLGPCCGDSASAISYNPLEALRLAAERWKGLSIRVV